MKFFLLLWIAVVSSFVFHSAEAQSVPTRSCSNPKPPLTPPPPAPGSAREIANIGVTPIVLCRLKPTKELLGYQGFTPIYQNSCAGLCLSLIKQSSICTATTKRILVSTIAPYVVGVNDTSLLTDAISASILGRGPAVYNPDRYSRIVDYVYGCSCTPAPCVVTVDSVSTTYKHGQIAYDKCNRRCTCSYGSLINCCRQRKEARTGMTTAERAKYIATVIAVSSVGSPLKPQYDALIQKHDFLFTMGIHSQSNFFPWHRQYLYDLEDVLQQYDCTVTVPYWRWSLEAAAPFASTIWSNTADGLGGNGFGGCVTTGPFASTTGWLTSEIPPQCLSRSWYTAATFATEAAISTATHVTCPSNFACFENSIQNFHNYVHVAIGGQMSGTVSSNDPVFWWHHSYIDFLWSKWQAKSFANLWALTPAVQNSSMPGGTYTPADFMDLNAQYGDPNKRVCYIEPSVVWPPILFDTLAFKNAEALQSMPQVAPSPFPEAWFAAMSFSKAQIEALRTEWCRLQSQPNIITREQALASGPLAASLGVLLNDEHMQQAGFADAAGVSQIELTGCMSDAPSESVPNSEPFQNAVPAPAWRPTTFSSDALQPLTTNTP